MVSLSPFQRTRDLLSNYPEKDGWIDMSIGSPKHEIPSFIKEIIYDNFAEFQNSIRRNRSIVRRGIVTPIKAWD